MVTEIRKTLDILVTLPVFISALFSRDARMRLEQIRTKLRAKYGYGTFEPDDYDL